MNDRELILAYMTLRCNDFRQRVEAARAGGFSGMSIRPELFRASLRTGLSVPDMRLILDDNGVSIREIEVIRSWALPGAAGLHSRKSEDEFYAMADAFGVRHVVATSEIIGVVDETVERFASLCDRAAEHGLLVVIEFLPWTTIPDAATAWDIVRQADRANGGIMIDTWHHFRGAADDQMLLTIPPEKIMVVQFDDADAQVDGTLLEDTFNRRLPGEGSFALEHFVRLLDDHGVGAPYSMEVISPSLWELPPTDAAKLVGDATRRVLSAAGKPSS